MRTARGVMRCTVSIGWLTHEDAKAQTDPRELHGLLELAVTEAKRKRDHVVRYTPELRHNASASRRTECSVCDCKFSFDIKRSEERADAPVWCPNCNATIKRPALPEVPVTITPPEV